MNKKQLPEFNPKKSGNFAAGILEKPGIRGILIGRLAVWAWLPENSARFRNLGAIKSYSAYLLQ